MSIAPVLEYNAIVWDQDFVGLSSVIEKVKKEATRLALKAPRSVIAPNYINYKQRCIKLAEVTLVDRRKLLRISSAAKIVNGKMKSNNADRLRQLLVRGRTTRNPNVFQFDRTMPPKSPLAIMLRDANRHANIFKITDSVLTTKVKLKQNFLSEYFIEESQLDIVT